MRILFLEDPISFYWSQRLLSLSMGKNSQQLAINFTVKFIVVEDETGGKNSRFG